VYASGQTGLGKSTLINTIFASHLIDSKGRLTPDEPVRTTTEIQTVSHIIEENGVRLRLNIVDTPGYGDQVNNDRCWDPIVKYIKDQHSAYLRKELTAQRERYIQDTRIHCCLFFIQPSGHALKPIDIVVLKKLSDVVNVVPVIAKSDSLTLEERSAFKERIKEEFAFHNLKMFPYDNDEFDEEERALNAQIKVGATRQKSYLFLTPSVEHYPICSRWIREINHCWWQASPWPPKPMGSYKRRGRDPLRICLSPKLPHPHPSPRSHRDHISNPLRDLPCQAIAGA
jgi:GTP-binding protein EngB required for normal cell division